mmetsp:Transcript_78854/g.219243  ORF Transcript_78854/g.219243 Transcript_78854/m.219243 type:complete len:250 (-) Transcript_78854:585-1334(-)
MKRRQVPEGAEHTTRENHEPKDDWVRHGEFNHEPFEVERLRVLGKAECNQGRHRADVQRQRERQDNEANKIPVVPESYAVRDPRAVVVKALHAIVAEGAVLRARRPVNLASAAPPERHSDTVHDLLHAGWWRALPSKTTLWILSREDAWLCEGRSAKTSQGHHQEHNCRQPKERWPHWKDRLCMFHLGAACFASLTVDCEFRKRRNEEKHNRQQEESTRADDHCWLGAGHDATAQEKPVVAWPRDPARN